MLPSTFNPIQPSPKFVTFCAYGDLVVIHVRVSSGPQPGSNEINAPAVGRLVPNALADPNPPASPFNDMFLNPVALRM